MYPKPENAETEGQRRLLELVGKKTFEELAAELRVDESTVRVWARGKSRPSRVLRERCREVLGWPPEIWDAGLEDDPATEPLPARALPSTQPRPDNPDKPESPESG